MKQLVSFLLIFAAMPSYSSIKKERPASIHLKKARPTNSKITKAKIEKLLKLSERDQKIIEPKLTKKNLKTLLDDIDSELN